MSLASPVLLAQGLALSTHHTTWPLPALAHGRIHTRPRRSNIRESGRQHARRRRLLSGWPCEPGLRRSVGFSHVCTYSELYTQSFWKYARSHRRYPPSPCSLRASIHPPIHPLSVSAHGGARSKYPGPAPPRALFTLRALRARHPLTIIGDCGLGSRACFSPTANG